MTEPLADSDAVVHVLCTLHTWTRDLRFPPHLLERWFVAVHQADSKAYARWRTDQTVSAADCYSGKVLSAPCVAVSIRRESRV